MQREENCPKRDIHQAEFCWHSAARDWVLGAYMRRKLLVALPFVVLLHIHDCLARGHTLRIELPGALRASPTQNGLFVRLLDDYTD